MSDDEVREAQRRLEEATEQLVSYLDEHSHDIADDEDLPLEGQRLQRKWERENIRHLRLVVKEEPLPKQGKLWPWVLGTSIITLGVCLIVRALTG